MGLELSPQEPISINLAWNDWKQGEARLLHIQYTILSHLTVEAVDF